MLAGKETKYIGLLDQHKGQAKVTTFNKGGTQEGKLPNVGYKEGCLMVQKNLCLCRQWYVRKWFCATKENHVCAANKMFEGNFVLLRQIIFVLQMICSKLVLKYQGNLCLCHGPNVKKLPCGTKSKHVVAVDQMLNNGFVAKAINHKPRPNFLCLEAQNK